MDELLLVDDIGVLIEKAEDNIEALDSIIESYDAQIQELFDKEQELIAEGASEVALECWWVNEASKNDYFENGVVKTLIKNAEKWYESTAVGDLQRVVEDENNVRIIRANAEKKYSKRFTVHTLYGKPLFDHINIFTTFIASPLKNIYGQLQHFFDSLSATTTRRQLQSGDLFDRAIKNNSFGKQEIGQAFISTHIDEMIKFLDFDWLKIQRLQMTGWAELIKQIEQIIEAKFTGAWLASVAIFRLQLSRFIASVHVEQLKAIRENMKVVHDICVFLLKLKDGKNESYELEDAELLDLDII